MVTHPAAGSPSKTLVNAALYHIRDLSQINGVYRPGIVHRLIRTPGLLAIAKTTWRAFVAVQANRGQDGGKVLYRFGGRQGKEDQGVIDKPIARHKVDRKKCAWTKRAEKP